MKNIFYIIGIAGCMAASCTEIEPLEMQAGGIPQDTETIREFKAAEHPLTMVWFDNWKADGNMNTYLNTPTSQVVKGEDDGTDTNYFTSAFETEEELSELSSSWGAVRTRATAAPPRTAPLRQRDAIRRSSALPRTADT